MHYCDLWPYFNPTNWIIYINDSHRCATESYVVHSWWQTLPPHGSLLEMTRERLEVSGFEQPSRERTKPVFRFWDACTFDFWTEQCRTWADKCWHRASEPLSMKWFLWITRAAFFEKYTGCTHDRYIIWTRLKIHVWTIHRCVWKRKPAQPPPVLHTTVRMVLSNFIGCWDQKPRGRVRREGNMGSRSHDSWKSLNHDRHIITQYLLRSCCPWTMYFSRCILDLGLRGKHRGQFDQSCDAHRQRRHTPLVWDGRPRGDVPEADAQD